MQPLPAIPDAPRHERLAYLDWLRGFAVLVMIEAHAVDAWTRTADRARPLYAWALVIGGMGAPLFLFLAGVAVVLAADARARRLDSRELAARSVRARGWRIFLYAYLFRLTCFVLSPGAPLSSLLKVDILNIMGPAIVGTAWIWERSRRAMPQAWLLAALTIGITMSTPIVRASSWLDPVPHVIQAYLRPSPGVSTFTLFPWAGFVTAGAVAGLLLVAAPNRPGRTAWFWAAASVVLVAGGYGCSLLPTLYEQSRFGTSSPTFFAIRVGVMSGALAAAYLWNRRRRLLTTWSPLRTLGASSLFVYWIHVELVYGLIARPLHHALSIPLVACAFAVFALLMLAVVLAKDLSSRWWNNRRGGVSAFTPTRRSA
jgi:uncharacterized membrane protein